MSQSLALRPLDVEPLFRLRDLLDLLTAVHQLREPLTTEPGLRAALELLAALAEMLGIGSEWIDRVEMALENQHVFEIVLAIVRYVSSLIDDAAIDELQFVVAEECLFDAQSFSQWLPLVLELLSLWRELRGA
jgi:hypothetical protein